MKKILFLISIISLSLLFTSCEPESFDNDDENPINTDTIPTEPIDSNARRVIVIMYGESQMKIHNHVKVIKINGVPQAYTNEDTFVMNLRKGDLVQVEMTLLVPYDYGYNKWVRYSLRIDSWNNSTYFENWLYYWDCDCTGNYYWVLNRSIILQ